MDSILSVQNQNFSGTEKCLQKFLAPTWKPKATDTDNSLDFGKACEDSSWKHCTSTPQRSETNGIAGRAVRRIIEGTSALLIQSGVDENRWADSMECYCYLRNIQDLLSDGAAIRRTVKGPIIPFGFDGRISPYFCQRLVATASVRQESLTRNIPRICIVRGENLERRHFGRRHFEELERMDASEIHAWRLNAKEELTLQKEFFLKKKFPVEDGTVKLSGGDEVQRTTHLTPGQPRPRRRTRKSSEIIRRVFTTTSRLIAG